MTIEALLILSATLPSRFLSGVAVHPQNHECDSPITNVESIRGSFTLVFMIRDSRFKNLFYLLTFF